MEGQKFDRLAKSLASGGSRRGVFAGLVGAASAGLAGLRRGARVEALAQSTCRQLGETCLVSGKSPAGCCSGLACQRTVNDTGVCVRSAAPSAQCPAGYQVCGRFACCVPSAVCADATAGRCASAS